MIQRLLVVSVVAVLGVEVQANTADFNALTTGTYTQGSSFTNGGLDFDILAGNPYVFAVHPLNPNPSFNGNYLNMNYQVVVAINLPTGASQIHFDFVRGGGWSLRINGGVITNTQVPGTINGVTVTQQLGTDNRWGNITAAGNMESFSFIGTEFWVDNLVADLTTDLAGDYNNDLVVDAADYVWWRKSAGNPSGYNSWRTNFGNPGSWAGFASAVPEPSAVTLAIVAIACLGLSRRRLNEV